MNSLGTANVTFCALPHLRAAGAGRIVNVSSRGRTGEPQVPAYGASKARLNALGQSLALALAGDGIAVSTVAPGFVETDMSNADLKAPRGAEIRAQSPFNRVAQPAEVAAAVLYLASVDAEWGVRRGARPQRRVVPALISGRCAKACPGIRRRRRRSRPRR